MKLQANNIAPDFSLPSVRGETLSLAALRGTPTLIQFHRFATRPACNITVRDYVREYEALRRAGLEVVMLFHSPMDELRPAMMPHKAPFHLLADPDERAYRAYGIGKSWLSMLSPGFMWKVLVGFLTGFAHVPGPEHGGMNGLPGDFLVDAEGTLRAVHYGKHASDVWTPAQALEAARTLGVLTAERASAA